jgi:hypothetical protein
LKEIWNLAGYRRDTFLNRPEFFIFIAYTMLMQANPDAPLNFHSLRQSMPYLTGLPRFNGIELPNPPVAKASFNPFEELDFDDFEGF